MSTLTVDENTFNHQMRSSMAPKKAHSLTKAVGKDQRTEQAQENALSAAAVSLLQSLDDTARPQQLPALYPRIVNQLATLWRRPTQLDDYFDELLLDQRGNRQGFPLKVVSELMDLKDYYLRVVYPKEELSVWEQAYHKAK
jgi:hypothetical protein